MPAPSHPGDLPPAPMAGSSTIPKVSVAMITYNHERYLAQAVESVLAQQTQWPFEVVVGEDCSTDGTRQVLLDLVAKHPGRVRPLLHEKNLGLLGKRNLAATFAECSGEYLILLEGDDFWSSPHKLQRQVDFLEAQRDCVACFHPVSIQGPDGVVRSCETGFPADMDRIGPRELLRFGFPHVMSLMFRRRLLPNLPEWFYELSMGDWSINLLMARQGPIGKVGDEALSTYRLHNTSFWLTRPLLDRTRDELQAMKRFRQVLEGACDEEVDGQINRRQFWLVDAYAEAGDFGAARSAFRTALAGWWTHRSVGWRWVARYALRAYAPWLVKWRRGTRNGT